MTTWTNPTHVTSGEADSGKFNEETVDNLLHIHEDQLTEQKFGGGTASGTVGTVGGETSCITVTHGLGWTPTFVVATGKSPIGGGNIAASCIADTYTSTTFRVRVIGVDAALDPGTSVTVSWIAGAAD